MLRKDFEYIPLKECKPRALYKVNCRNFSLGVYDGKSGFIGLRNKFGNWYLFTEYAYEIGPPFGTVFPIEYIGMIPKNIEVSEESDALYRLLFSILNL